MSRLIVKGDIGKVAAGAVTASDMFHIPPAEFGIGGGAVATGREHALRCICDATFLFENVYVCKLNELDQVKIPGSELERFGLRFYAPMFATYGYDAPLEIRRHDIATSQARFIEDVLWKQRPDAVALSFAASVKLRREGFAGSAINGSVAIDRLPEEKPNDFNTDPLINLPEFREGYMWFTGISVDMRKIAVHRTLQYIDRAFYYLKGLEPKGSYKHHCHGLITDSLPPEWLDQSTIDWPSLDGAARRFLDARTALDDFPVHLSDVCEMVVFKAAVWAHGEEDIEYHNTP